MDEHDKDKEDLAAQGVRIIGAEEAAAALEAGEATGRRPVDQPRYGDVPPPPEGPRPAHRFPQPDGPEASHRPSGTAESKPGFEGHDGGDGRS
ncbi:MAG: hypothetical protein ACRD1G_15540, partial [Acidimicrobiales bacterium]